MRLPSLLTARRHQAVVLAAAATGVLTGLAVAGFERLTDQVVLDAVLDWPLWAQAVAPAVGLAVAALALRFLAGGASPATADAYVANFHDRAHRLDLRAVPGRLLAGVATIGSGGAMGLEGPSIYVGSAAGSALQHRLRALLRGEDPKLLLVAGAAAGVAAVFKAPATGVVFALEVPYTDDVARRALIPALVAAATSYVTFAALVGTEPLFAVLRGGERFGVVALGGAAALGLLAGAGARGFSLLVHAAKRLSTSVPPWQRVVAAGAVMAALVVAGSEVYDRPLIAGPGYNVFGWVSEPERALGAVALLFALRMAATGATLAGGGTGGLFIPLVVQGVLLGRFVAGVLDQPDSTLFPVIGIAAFLGAGYRTPLASVMFVAETTGRAAYVVPALVASATAQLVMGRASVSAGQQSTRAGHLERRFRLPVTAALTTDVLTVPPDATAAEFVWVHVIGRREREVPVVDEGRYVGMCRLEDVSEVPREAWETTAVADLVRGDLPVGRPSWTLRDAVAALEDAGVDRLAITDADGMFIGLVLVEEIVKLDEILDETGG